MAKYQQYKDSGFEWLGEVPSHWKVCRLKHVKANKPNAFVDGPFGSNLKSIHFVDDGDVYVIESNFATTGIINEDNLKTITSNHFQTISRSEAEVGDIIIAKIGARFGMSSILPKLTKKSVVSGNSLKLTINSKVCNTEYVHYLLQHSKSESAMDDGVNVTAQPALSLGGLNNLPFLLPSSEEQDNITKFLSYETAQIDTLIEKQQTLIQLLKEKRQAVISHAVTKGLNPDAPMKDSGVEWLGEVPEHWDVSKLKYYSSIQGGYAFSSDSFTEEGVQILKIGNVYQNRLALERQPTFVPEVILEALPDFIVKDGDILMSLTGTLGKRDYGFAVAIKDDGKYLLNQRVAKLNPADEKIDRDFLLNVLWSESYLNQLYSLPSGTKQANLSNSDVLDIVITLPPSKTEQKEIAVELQNQKDTFDKAIQKAMTSIELMQERRTALISAAVTGKIDVRGWRAPE